MSTHGTPASMENTMHDFDDAAAPRLPSLPWRAAGRLAGAVACLAILSACGGDGGGDAPAPAPLLSTATVRKLDQTIAQELKDADLPSAAVGIWIGGQPAYVSAQGAARLGGDVPRGVDQPFRIASITKTFIATVVLMLADDGRLALSDPLSKWYAGFPNAERIRVVDLLDMRSGIPDSLGEEFLAEYYADPLLTLGAEDMIARAAALPASRFIEPGTRTLYTNINFVLLERIAEKASGQPIRAFLQARIFGPLGMGSTVYPTGTDLPGPLRGYSFEPGTGSFVDRTRLDPAPAGGAGALISTLDDLRTYARQLCGGGLLAPATQRARLVTTAFDGQTLIGYGQGIARIGRFCGHNGTIFGFSSEMWYLPERDAVVIVSVNRLDADDRSRSFELFAKVTKLVFPDQVDW